MQWVVLTYSAASAELCESRSTRPWNIEQRRNPNVESRSERRRNKLHTQEVERQAEKPRGSDEEEPGPRRSTSGEQAENSRGVDEEKPGTRDGTRQRIPEELAKRNQDHETARVKRWQRIPEDLTRRNQDHETARVESRQRFFEELTVRNQDYETARVESRQRALEDLTMKDKGRGKMRMRSKQSAPDVWMVKERETVDVQPQEERNERASSSATGVAVREQQHQMPSHVQIFIPDRVQTHQDCSTETAERKKERDHLQRKRHREMHVLWIGAVESESQVLL